MISSYILGDIESIDISDYIHRDVPEEWRPSKERLIYFIKMCDYRFGTNECILWHHESDKLATFRLNKKKRSIRQIAFMWHNGYIHEKNRIFSSCGTHNCVNGRHLHYKSKELKTEKISVKLKKEREPHLYHRSHGSHKDHPCNYHLYFLKRRLGLLDDQNNGDV